MWASSYADACAEVDVTPRPEVSQMQGGRVELAGNTFERFQQRLTDDEFRAVVAAATRCPVITELLVPYNHITSVGARCIAEALRCGFDTLMVLDVSHNSIHGDAVAALAAAVQEGCPTLCQILLAGNPLGGSCGPALGAALQATACGLVKLDLNSTDLDMKALVHVCHALAENTSLLSLNIGKPLMTNPDDVTYVIHHLTLALLENSTLTELGLSHFMLTDGHLQSLLPSFCACAVTSLSLKGNKLSQDAGEMLSRLLERKQDFLALDVSANRLRDVGAVALARGVRSHAGLRALFLEHNTIGEVGLTAVAEAVGHCRSLSALTVWGNDFSGDSIQHFHHIQDRLEQMEFMDFGLHTVDGEPAIHRA